MRLAQVSGVKTNPIQQNRYIAFGVLAQKALPSADNQVLRKLIALAEERLEAIRKEQKTPFIPKASNNTHGQLAAKFSS